MRDDLAIERYLARYAERDTPEAPVPATPWRQVLVLPAYRESATVLARLAQLTGNAACLAILVLNRPEQDPDPEANRDLREAVAALPGSAANGQPIHHLSGNLDVFPLDLDHRRGVLPREQAVGLARKAGMDTALSWHAAGAIDSHWLCTSDADTGLPADYFRALQDLPAGVPVATFPFRHVPGPDEACNRATRLYELRLHHYVLGLEYAGSPYAFHALGSCLAVRPAAYARVRGVPRRSGAEDFYLLNKLSKLGPVGRPDSTCLQIDCRLSTRVPFGTGPAVEAIAAEQDPAARPLFYDPACFRALRALLDSLPALAREPGTLRELLAGQGMPAELVSASAAALEDLGITDALAHCARQASSDAGFVRHFHGWFDAFRSLKFIHALRDAGWPMRSLAELEGCTPRLWPAAATDTRDPDELSGAIRAHWSWRT